MKYLQTFRFAAFCVILVLGVSVSTVTAQNDSRLNLLQGFTANPFMDNLVRHPLTKKAAPAASSIGRTNPVVANLKADYRFQGNLNSSVAGAPAMTDLGTGNSFVADTVDGVGRQSLRFPKNNGLTVNTAALIQNNNYTIVVLFKFDDVSGFRKIIDFANGTTDNGLYINNGIFEHENIPGSPGFSTGTYAQVVVVRESSGLVRQYRNGVLADSRNDGGDYLITAHNRLGFFQDDAPTNGTESSAGNVARIRIYDGPLTNAEVLALDRLPAAATPTPTLTPSPSPSPSPSPTPDPCPYSLSSTQRNLSRQGFIGTVTVTKREGCRWTALSNATFIDIRRADGNSPFSLTGELEYKVEPNPGAARTGTITIAGQIFTVHQERGCQFVLNPTQQVFPSRLYGTGTFDVITEADCKWVTSVDSPDFAVRDAAFGEITLGNGTVNYHVRQNLIDVGRATQIRVYGVDGASQTSLFTVFQNDTAGCSYLVSPDRANFGAQSPSGNFQMGSISVEAPAGCSWRATSHAPWLITDTQARVGSGTLEYIVQNNVEFGADARDGNITIAEQELKVSQTGYHGHCPIFVIYCYTAPNACTFPTPRPTSSPSSSNVKTPLGPFYTFRDEVLATTPRGKKYTKDYYRYAGEITKLMIFNPRLLFRIKEAFARYEPVVTSVVNHQPAVASLQQPEDMAMMLPPTMVTDSELNDVDDLLTTLMLEAGEQLRPVIEQIRKDIRDPQVHAEFGVKVTRGEVRSLPEETKGLFGLSGNLWSPDSSPVPDKLNPTIEQQPEEVSQSALQTRENASVTLSQAYAQMPLGFEANQGQVDRRIDFLSRGEGYNLALTSTEAVLSLRSKGESDTQAATGALMDLPSQVPDTKPAGSFHSLIMKIVGADPASQPKPLGELPGKTNYFTGNDAAQWRTDIPNYSSVEYEQIYKGVNLVYYGNQRQLEYDFKVFPGANPKAIKLRFDGADKVELDAQGDLILHTPVGEVRQHRPRIYQEIDGVIKEIAGGYVFKGRNLIGFQIGKYDRQRVLIIDPVMVYSTYLGGSGSDGGSTITVDAAGNAYVIGFTDSVNFPVVGAVQPMYGGNPQDVFVAKLNPSGTALLYSTYLGGSGQDNGAAIAVDGAGNAYITGYTGSDNFPTANAMQPFRRGLFNAFVAKLSPNGSQLIYSTYLGGSIGEFGSGIAVDAIGSVYVGGVTSSPNFPTVNPIQAGYGGDLADAFVAKLNSEGTRIVYSTFLGGFGNDGVTEIALDSTGNAYITGVTYSPNYPTTPGLRRTFGGGAFDAFVTKINPSGTSLVYSTYLGGSDDDRAYRIALDGAGSIHVTGQTASANFPVLFALQPTFGGGSDAFVAKLSPTGAISYSTFLGGSGLDGATGLAVNTEGNVFLTGFTTSTDFPLASPLQAANNGGAGDAFVVKLRAVGTSLDYSTYLGGGGADTGFDIAVDLVGNPYILGQTNSTNFPTSRPLQPANGGGSFDVFITKIVSGVEVSGRVVDPGGRGMASLPVTITDSAGNTITRVTTSFGIYTFTDVPTGQQYTIVPRSKKYKWGAPRVLTVNSELRNIDFVGVE